MLKLDFLGANDTVTGSRTLLTFQNKKWLIDCGLFQGDKTKRQRNWLPFEPSPKGLEAVILTHAHLDHTGYLPRLCREGFRGLIHATAGTADLTRILLLDAAHLEEETASFANATRYSYHYPAQPLFTTADAENAIGRLTPHARETWIPLTEGLSYRFIRAGHIIGASLVQFAVECGDQGTKIITFSGDLGNDRSLHLRAPETLKRTDTLILESTYGDRIQPRENSLRTLEQIIKRTVDRGGVVVIPAFAVGRAQEITFMLRLLEKDGRLPSVPVILDSPMATAAMAVCLRHSEDQVVNSAFNGEDNPFKPSRFEVTRTADQSMLACMRDGPLIVISASGMLNGGRILHHLKARLPDPKNTVLFSGYQAEGSKGRYLQEHGHEGGTLRIHHQEIAVAAEIVTMDHLSSHADQTDIMLWLRRMEQLPSLIVLNHGEVKSQEVLAKKITAELKIEVARASETPSIQIK